jgi:hypothetical protein
MVYIPPPSRGSQRQLYDFVPRAGIYTNPGVIVQRNDDGTMVIDTDKEIIHQYHRHTNTTGLTPEEKDLFNDIMDNIIAMEDNGDRINQLQGLIDELRQEPTNKRVVDRLRNQQAELIRWAKALPRVYNTSVEKIR